MCFLLYPSKSRIAALRSRGKNTEITVKLKKNLALAILQYQRKGWKKKPKTKTPKPQPNKKQPKKKSNNFPSPTNRKGEGGIPPQPQYSI